MTDGSREMDWFRDGDHRLSKVARELWNGWKVLCQTPIGGYVVGGEVLNRRPTNSGWLSTRVSGAEKLFLSFMEFHA